MTDSATTAPTFPSLDELRARGTLKWTAYDADVLPMWVAESDAATCPAVAHAVRAAADREFFGYPPRDHSGLGEATADWCRRRYGWEVDPARVHAAADVVRGVVLAVRHLTEPGSPVIVPTPAYMPFFEVGPVAERETVFVPTLDRGPDPEAVDRAFAAGAGALILANPNNPLGFTYDEETLRELADIADRHGARIISDEIHAPIVLEGRHVPTASVSEAAERVTVTVTATSKGWNTAGLKCAQIILNEEDDRRWAQVPHVAKEGVATLGQIAAVAAYRDGEAWLDGFLDVLRANRDEIARRLPEVLPGARFTPADASYLAWIDLTGVEPIMADVEAGRASSAQQWLLKNARVAVNPGEAFGDGGEGHVRLNYATSPEILAEGLDRIAAAVAKAG
ncbi:MalY/PatB family protein [Corynebacterium sp. 335C]